MHGMQGHARQTDLDPRPVKTQLLGIAIRACDSEAIGNQIFLNRAKSPLQASACFVLSHPAFANPYPFLFGMRTGGTIFGPAPALRLLGGGARGVTAAPLPTKWREIARIAISPADI